jgi:putative ABC transport system substrate-binding protein
LQYGSPDTPEEQKRVDDALAEIGWIVGQNVLLDRRYVRMDDLQPTAQEFVNAKGDLIIASGTPATLAAKRATTSVPILMWSAADPVAAGLVASLARPGGNVTGMAMLSPEQAVKRLSLLRELLPGIRRVGVLGHSGHPGLVAERERLEEAYRSAGVEAILVDTARFQKLEDMLAEVVQRRAQALDLIQDTLYASWIPQVFSAAMRVSLPTIVDTSDLLEVGALLSYEEDQREFLHRDAVLFDKLLRGTRPADLPVEQPTKFVLGINLRTAKALGITVPQSLLQRADNVIR